LGLINTSHFANPTLKVKSVANNSIS
jgi:hypothetical protein